MSYESEWLEDELDRLVGEEATWIVGGPAPDFDEVLDDYSNAEIATAAGFTGGGKGTRRWQQRRTFMRNLQRYRQARDPESTRQARHPGAVLRRQVERAGLEIVEREATPATLAAVLRLVRRHGLTMSFEGLVRVSEDLSRRKINNVFCSPSRLAGMLEAIGRGDYEDAFEILWAVFVTAYGVPAMSLEVFESGELVIGRQPSSAAGRRVA